MRCWVDIGGTKHFGPGPAELLELIQESGSISKAAKKMGMSYKKAWAMIEKINKRGKQPYVSIHHGGKKGGGTELTPSGKKVLASFNKLNSRLQDIAENEKELLTWI